MIGKTIKIGSRGSNLALAQSNYVINLIRRDNPDLVPKLTIIKTEGDSDRKSSLENLGGIGVFTKKIESELLEEKIDIAVHSAKDLPSVMTDGLVIGAVPEREDYRDVWISRKNIGLMEIDDGAVIGTSSPRRRAQLLNIRPYLCVKDIRGNIETRLRKINDGEYDALIMAAAGLKRAGLDNKITEYLSTEIFIPAPGQGALVIQVRADDEENISLAGQVDNAMAHRCLDIERLLLKELNAGCSAAVGGLAETDDETIRLTAVVLDKDGRNRLFESNTISIDKPDNLLIEKVVGALLSRGAGDLIANA